MGNCRRYSALAVPIQSDSALAVPSYFFIVTDLFTLKKICAAKVRRNPETPVIQRNEEMSLLFEVYVKFQKQRTFILLFLISLLRKRLCHKAGLQIPEVAALA